MKTRSGNKKELWIVIINLLALLLIFFLTHFLSIYPGGYSIEKQNGDVFIGKGADIKVVALNDSVLNELKIASLESRIADLKNIWYVGLLFSATFLLVTVNFKRLKLTKAVIITASIYAVLTLLIIFLYASTISSIENSINILISV